MHPLGTAAIAAAVGAILGGVVQYIYLGGDRGGTGALIGGLSCAVIVLAWAVLQRQAVTPESASELDVATATPERVPAIVVAEVAEQPVAASDQLQQTATTTMVEKPSSPQLEPSSLHELRVINADLEGRTDLESEARFEALYRGRTIDVTGEVRNVSRGPEIPYRGAEIENFLRVSLRASDDDGDFPVRALFSADNSQIPQLRRGDLLTLRGELVESVGVSTLLNCEILAIGASSASN